MGAVKVKNAGPVEPEGRCQGGFTLLELVLVLALFGLVVALAAEPLRQAVEASFRTQELSDAQTELGAGMDRMSRDIRGLEATCENGGSRLVLRFPDGEGDTLTYGVVQGRLYIHAGSGPLDLEDLPDQGSLLAGTSEQAIESFQCADENDLRDEALYLPCATRVRLTLRGGREIETLAVSRPCLL